MYAIQHIARDVIYRCKFTFSNLKLQKILYFVYAANLYEHKKRFIKEHPEAWLYGPVFSDVYHEYKHFGSKDIIEIEYFDEITDEIYNETTDLILEQLKSLSEKDLIVLTHRKNGAWAAVYSPNKKCVVIPDDLIEKEFKSFYVKE